MAGKLGKAKAEFEDRDFPMRALLKTVIVPPEYDVDAKCPNIVYPMYANDQLGCCVIAGRAHQTLRFELFEQNQLLSITDQEVIQQYLHETGGVDSGLVVSKSLKNWRQRGWVASGKRYYARAYARIYHWYLPHVRAAIYSDVGVGCGFNLPNSAIDQFDRNQLWDVVDDERGEAGGHFVYMPAYHSDGGFTCVTWGRRQKMTERFFKKYADESWAVWDSANVTAKTKNIFNTDKAEEMLKKAA